MENFDERYKKFSETMKNGEGDGMQRLDKAMHEMQMDIFSKMPVWAKFNFFCNITTSKSDDEIDWDKVNKILDENKDEYSFNIYETIKNKQQLIETRINCITAQCGLGAWIKGTCKDCGEIFYLGFDEVEFFRNNNLRVPKRCHKCRDKKNGKSVAQKNIVKTTQPAQQKEKTAFEIAMEKLDM
jgi:hypothetical protein